MPDRSAAGTANWLSKHPGSAREGAPQALQVTDGSSFCRICERQLRRNCVEPTDQKTERCCLRSTRVICPHFRSQC